MKIKSAISVFAAAAVLAGMTACSRPPEDDSGIGGIEGSEPSGSTGSTSADVTPTEPPATIDDSLLEVPVEEVAIEQTLTHGAVEILERNTFSLFVETGFEKDYHRRGDDIRVNLVGIAEWFVAGGRYYSLCFSTRAAYYRPATPEDFENTLELFSGFEQLIHLDGAELIDIGVEPFPLLTHLGDMYFEEFIDGNGQPLRAYFNNEGELFGLNVVIAAGTPPRVIKYHLTENVRANVFQPPFGWDTLPESERP
jgi:hypothetical protein